MLKLQTSFVVGEYLSSYNQYCYSHPFKLPINKPIIIIQYQNHTNIETITPANLRRVFNI